jgi:hypothetical protein
MAIGESTMKRRVCGSALLIAVFVACAISVQAQDALKPMVGKWKTMLSYTGGGGRFTVGLAEDTEIKQIDPNTITVTLKPVTSAQPVFDVRLSRHPAGKNYLLTVKTDGAPTITNLALSAGADGLSGTLLES